MTTPKKAIAEILATFKNSDETLWTEDGSPALEAVQKLAEDDTITRAQIDEAIPGFVRVKPGDLLAKNTTPPVEAKNTRVAAEPHDDTDDFSTEQTREILDRRVRDAEANLLAAQRAVTEAHQDVVRCEKRLARAHDDHKRQFPPITPAANIKAHLQAQIDLSRERAGLGKENRAQVDVSMERSNRRGQGQGRPTRPVNNVNVSTAA
jgi:hypothetical protein